MSTIRFNLKVLGRFHWSAGIAVLVMIMSQACSTVPMPTSDSTPPILNWNVYNEDTRTTSQYIGNATLSAKSGDSYRVTLTAEDPQGIHEITLGSSTSWQCVSGDLAQNAGPSLDATDKQDLQPDSQGNVLTSILLMRQANIGPFDCQAGFTFNGGSVAFFGTGTNYFNGVTQATLTFNVSK